MLAFAHHSQATGADLFSTLCLVFFVAAISHALLSDRFLIFAHRYETSVDKSGSGLSFAASFYFFVGNITCIFGLWLIPLLVYLAYHNGIDSAFSLFHESEPNEAVFNFVMVAIAMTRPMRYLFANVLRYFSSLFQNQLMFWWLGSFFLTILLSGLISEIAAMTLQCALLSHFFYNLKPGKSLSYFTLSVLLVCGAFGNTVIPFNLNEMFNFRTDWGWSGWDVFYYFGWKSFLSLAVAACMGAVWFRKEFALLQASFDQEMEKVSRHPINYRLIFYLVLLVLASLSKQSLYAMFAFLVAVIFLHKRHFMSEEEGELNLRDPLLIAFFTYTLEIYASLQSWWVLPMLEGIEGWSLYFATLFLTGLNENVPIQAASGVLQQTSEMIKFLFYLGLAAGGGITFFANSSNILAKEKLNSFFEYRAISPIRQMFTALPIAFFVSILIVFLNYLGL